MPDELKPAPKKESVWKRLTRLFRSGPVIRHRVGATDDQYTPKGTASAYKRELSSLYVHTMASYGQYERLSRYADYTEMCYTPEIDSALKIFADEATPYDERNAIIKVVAKDQAIKRILETLYFDILNIEFRLWGWVRNLCMYGDFVLFIDATAENGILNLLPIPINEIEREEGFDKDDPFAVRYRWLTRGNAILENWQVVHFRLEGNDTFLPYGTSMIESARRIWRQLILIEDAMLVYRIVRSPERRVHYVDVGGIPHHEVEQFIEQVKTRTKRTQVVDPTSGRVDLRYNPMSVDEDYWIPVRGDVRTAARIETLPGGQFTGDVEDVQYIQNKLFAALGIPKAYLGYEGDLGSKATLAQQDVRFSRTIERIQRVVISELQKVGIAHLYILGYEGEDLTDWHIEMANASNIAEQQKLELWRTRLEIAGTAQEGMLDREFVYKTIFMLADEEIEKIREGKRVDKLEDLTLEAMQAPAPGPEGGTPPEGGGEKLPGEEELPKTLGGEPGGGPEAGGAPAVAPEGVLASLGPILSEGEPGDQEDELEERRNPGSEGDQAELSVRRGKDLFSTGEDGHTLVFGTKKQTATDPGDMRSLRRLVTRPFSESEETRLKRILDEGVRSTQSVAALLAEARKTLS